MIIIPAIDIRAGNCVMLTQGRIEDETIYSKDPVFIAKLWQAKGAKRLHVVDLDGAFHGSPQNLEVIKKIRQNVNMPIQLGGGVRSAKTIELLFDMGIDFVIVGTLAIYNPDILRQAIEKYGTKIIAAVDVRDNKVAIGGWKETTTVDAKDIALKLKSMGIEEIISTDIKKDGTMEGPNLEGLREIACASSLRVIASGGISSLDDIINLKKLECDGISGAIIGKAIYTEAIQLEEAIKIGEKK